MFEAIDIPDLCLYQDKCINLKDYGCFLSLIKRKHIIRLDEKYLIIMAEKRGLFGETSPKKSNPKPIAKCNTNEDVFKVSHRRKTTAIHDSVELVNIHNII